MDKKNYPIILLWFTAGLLFNYNFLLFFFFFFLFFFLFIPTILKTLLADLSRPKFRAGKVNDNNKNMYPRLYILITHDHIHDICDLDYEHKKKEKKVA